MQVRITFAAAMAAIALQTAAGCTVTAANRAA